MKQVGRTARGMGDKLGLDLGDAAVSTGGVRAGAFGGFSGVRLRGPEDPVRVGNGRLG